MDAQPFTDDVAATSLPSLLRVTETRTLQEFSEHVESWAELDEDCEVRGLGPGASEGVEVRVGLRGTDFLYPFPLSELYFVASELEEVYEFYVNCEWLAGEIESVEGIGVKVGINHLIDPALVDPRADRRETSTADLIQLVPEYPYQRAMSGANTFNEWRLTRFARNFRGLEVEVTRPVGGIDLASVTLAELRKR